MADGGGMMEVETEIDSITKSLSNIVIISDGYSLTDSEKEFFKENGYMERISKDGDLFSVRFGLYNTDIHLDHFPCITICINDRYSNEGLEGIRRTMLGARDKLLQLYREWKK